MTDDKMLARIAALLRQAEGTDNPHEADAFMRQRNDWRQRRQSTLPSHGRTPPRARRYKLQSSAITIGAAGARGLRTYVRCSW